MSLSWHKGSPLYAAFRATCGGAAAVLAVLAVGWCAPALAQVGAPPKPVLLAMVQSLTANGTFAFDALEAQAAAANDAAFASLEKICLQPTAQCTGEAQQLFNQLRSLEDNANELLNNGGETQYSLRLPPAGIAAALRWTAPEEFAAQGSMATKFFNTQSAVLANRLAALRFASHGIAFAGLGELPAGAAGQLADAGGAARGGGASADPADFGRWSVFANGSFGAGSKDPTTFEDAFNFDNTVASVGADVRLSRRVVVGLLAGHTEQRVDFNSEESIVDGRVRGNGQSFTAYLQVEGEAAYLNLSVGQQHLSVGMTRKITYPSNNPDIPSVNDTATSATGVNSLTAALGSGYTFQQGAVSAEPYLNVTYMGTDIKAFTEHNSNGFDFSVAHQSIQSLEGAVGLKLACVVSGRLGVLAPYVYGEARRQFRDDARQIDSSYVGGLGGSAFDLPTDPATRYYYVVGGGASVVLRHGLQGFVQYVKILEYANYTDHVVTGGIRWEL